MERILTRGQLSDVVERDVEAIAALEGAQAGLEEARAALTAFEREHDAELVAERLQDRMAERDRLIRAARAFLDAERDWNAGVLIENAHARACARALPSPAYPPTESLREVAAWLREVVGDPSVLVPLPRET